MMIFVNIGKLIMRSHVFVPSKIGTALVQIPGFQRLELTSLKGDPSNEVIYAEMSVIVRPDEDETAISSVLAETIKSGKLGRNLNVDPAYLVVQQLLQDEDENSVLTENGN